MSNSTKLYDRNGKYIKSVVINDRFRDVKALNEQGFYIVSQLNKSKTAAVLSYSGMIQQSVSQ